jgi:hypothetical protein
MRIKSTKIGDVFSVKITENSKKYFQLIAFDSTQLNSDVIRAFKKEYSLSFDPDLSEIINDDVQFYAHCATKLGIRMNVWENVANVKEIGNTSKILFKDTNDYARRADQEPILISNNWYVWKIGEPFEKVYNLNGENKNAYVGLVINPLGILELLKGNEYPKNYPK